MVSIIHSSFLHIILEFKLIQRKVSHSGIHYCVTKKDITIRTNNNFVKIKVYELGVELYVHYSFTIAP